VKHKFLTDGYAVNVIWHPRASTRKASEGKRKQLQIIHHEMLLIAISADLGYPIFTDSNEKFISLFVRVFRKIRGRGALLLQIQLQTGKLLCY